MENQIVFNGKDLYKSFGAYLKEGATKGIIQYPNAIKGHGYSWHEESGTDYGRQEVILAPRIIEFALLFPNTTDYSTYERFMAHAWQGELALPQLAYTIKWLSIKDEKITRGAWLEANLQYIEKDFINPYKNEPYKPHTANTVTHYYLKDYQGNETHFATHGATALQGTSDQLLKGEEQKQRLFEISEYNQSDRFLDEGFVTKPKARNAKLFLRIEHTNPKELLQAYYTLMEAVKNAQWLYAPDLKKKFRIRYQANTIEHFVYIGNTAPFMHITINVEINETTNL